MIHLSGYMRVCLKQLVHLFLNSEKLFILIYTSMCLWRFKTQAKFLQFLVQMPPIHLIMPIQNVFNGNRVLYLIAIGGLEIRICHTPPAFWFNERTLSTACQCQFSLLLISSVNDINTIELLLWWMKALLILWHIL